MIHTGSKRSVTTEAPIWGKIHALTFCIAQVRTLTVIIFWARHQPLLRLDSKVYRRFKKKNLLQQNNNMILSTASPWIYSKSGSSLLTSSHEGTRIPDSNVDGLILCLVTLWVPGRWTSLRRVYSWAGRWASALGRALVQSSREDHSTIGVIQKTHWVFLIQYYKASN